MNRVKSNACRQKNVTSVLIVMSTDLETKTPKKSKPNACVCHRQHIAAILFIIGLFSFGVYTVQKEINKIKRRRSD